MGRSPGTYTFCDTESTENDTNVKIPNYTAKKSYDFTTARWEENMVKIAEKERELE